MRLRYNCKNWESNPGRNQQYQQVGYSPVFCFVSLLRLLKFSFVFRSVLNENLDANWRRNWRQQQQNKSRLKNFEKKYEVAFWLQKYLEFIATS